MMTTLTNQFVMQKEESSKAPPTHSYSFKIKESKEFDIIREQITHSHPHHHKSLQVPNIR